MITLYDGSGHFIGYDSLTFSGGEEHIRLKTPHGSGPVRIEARLWSSREIFQLLIITDALRRRGFHDIDLVLPYVSYARQDRVCNEGEALSVKVFCDIVNSQKYRSVEIWDPHSDVTPALLDRCQVYQQKYFVAKASNVYPNCVLVAPDAGALKKTFEAAELIQGDYISATKHRDTKTGEITKVSVPYLMQDGKNYLIVDDICDGGRTFIEVSKAIRTQVPRAQVRLYVTHGIFSKGLDVLKPYIDHVYTANIFPDRYQGNEGYVTVLRR